MRRIIALLTIPIMLGGGAILWGLAGARADPVVRRATIVLPDWPAEAPAAHVVLISDIHIGTIAMGAGRLTRIVGQVNALKPDLVLIAGDFIYGHERDGAARFGDAMIAPLAMLRARLGVVAVLGNHDHWTGSATVRNQLARANVTVLDNQAIVRGPMVIGGIGDEFTGRADIPATVAATRGLVGARVLLSHSPDLASRLPPAFPLLLAGHTHCGQVRVFGRSPGTQPYIQRYRCGLIREAGRAVVVTAGLGTSAVPVRIGAPPDLWLLTLRGPTS